METKSIKDQVLEKNRIAKEGGPKVELNHQAFSIVKNGENGMWTVLKIPYDFTTKTVGTPEVISEDIDRMTAIERYKISVAKSGLLG